MQDVKKRTRKPARRFEVDTNKQNIWDALGNAQVNMSFKDRLAIDKQAAKDLCDGIRSIHGRKPRKTTTNLPLSTQVNAVNLVGSDGEESEVEDEKEEEWEVEDEKEEEWEDELDGDDEGSASESYLFDSEFEDDDADGYLSDGSITQYPYNPESMGTARPFAVKVHINGEPVEAIADTGFSVSHKQTTCKAFGSTNQQGSYVNTTAG
ncbi:hypothetical protein O0I10_012233 [Lichtheimia ornata]|uniref:Uncharacterized protein n=1 Tax=Lichtheimia ornata TaxID=688661 RepID=A0AAD7URE0_9FUNG|nr:uncharacterized protein O0I10_012233 [Lichtheimia ornata]KAJ8652128.1 hypothetical protein O0I10_012233 [Lichtheimia ornata]